MEHITDSNVFAGLVTYLDAPLEAILASLESASNAAAGDPGIPATVLPIDPEKPMPAIAFGAADREEVEAMLAFRGGREFNLSSTEIAEIAALDITSPLDEQELQIFSDGYRQLLQSRLDAYLQMGLEGIAHYDRGRGNSIAPGDHLGRVNAVMATNIARFKPLLAKELRSYPKISVRDEDFVLIRKPRDGTMVYVLVHRVADRGDRDAMLVHREYYVGSSYDATQVLIAALPHGQGTLVIVSNDVITDEVAGFGSSVKHRVGRARVQVASEPILKELRRSVEAKVRAAR